jgi:hypothetical protein
VHQKSGICEKVTGIILPYVQTLTPQYLIPFSAAAANKDGGMLLHPAVFILSMIDQNAPAINLL